MFVDVTTGAANDIEKATEVARTMVIEYGMSRLGPVNLVAGDNPMFGVEGKQLSESTQSAIDKEVSYILEEAYKRAELALKQNRKKLDEVAAVGPARHGRARGQPLPRLERDRVEELLAAAQGVLVAARRQHRRVVERAAARDRRLSGGRGRQDEQRDQGR